MFLLFKTVATCTLAPALDEHLKLASCSFRSAIRVSLCQFGQRLIDKGDRSIRVPILARFRCRVNRSLCANRAARPGPELKWEAGKKNWIRTPQPCA